MANIASLTPFNSETGKLAGQKSSRKGVPNSKKRLLRFLELVEELTNPVTNQIEGMTVAEQLDLAQIIKARKGDTRAYEALFDRLEGRPKQEIDNKLTGDIKVALVKFIDSK